VRSLVSGWQLTLCDIVWQVTIRSSMMGFLCAKAATAIARLSQRNSVCPSVCHTGGSVKNGAG